MTSTQHLPAHEAAKHAPPAEPPPIAPDHGPILVRRRSMPDVVIEDDSGARTTYATRMPSAEELAVAAEAVAQLQRVRDIRDLSERVREALSVFLVDAGAFLREQPISVAVEALRQLPERYQRLSAEG